MYVLLHKLSSTSALVLLWSKKEIHKSNLVSKYMKSLRLDAGKKLFSKCNQICPYYDEVIKNRKHCILNLTIDVVQKNKIKQIIILGSGMDALSLEIYSKIKNIEIFEIDFFNMNVKRKIFNQIDKNLTNSIKLIPVDLSKQKIVFNSLKKAGWRKNVTTLVIAEGISYYFIEEKLWNIIRIFKSKYSKNYLLLEYLVPHKSILKKRAIIPERIFHTIRTDLDLSCITRYNIEQIKNNLVTFNGKIIKSYTMKEMEKNRKGKNYHFKTSNSGWIEICYCSI